MKWAVKAGCTRLSDAFPLTGAHSLNASGYTALIDPKVFEWEGPILLATSRVDDPVAAEIPVGPGVVFLLPSGVDDALLAQALDGILDVPFLRRRRPLEYRVLTSTGGWEALSTRRTTIYASGSRKDGDCGLR